MAGAQVTNQLLGTPDDFWVFGLEFVFVMLSAPLPAQAYERSSRNLNIRLIGRSYRKFRETDPDARKELLPAKSLLTILGNLLRRGVDLAIRMRAVTLLTTGKSGCSGGFTRTSRSLTA